MDVQLGERRRFSASEALRVSAGLVRTGLTAFMEGNPFRGRRVQEAGRQLLADIDAWQEDALLSFQEDTAALERDLALSHQVEALARAAQQLAALAESRPATQTQPELRAAVGRLGEPLLAALAQLEDERLRADSHEALDEVRRRKPAFLAECARMARDDRRLFSSCLLAVAASQRIEEAAEAAAAAMKIEALRLVVA